MWDGVKIGGKIYTVPGTYKEYVTNGFVWREEYERSTICLNGQISKVTRLIWMGYVSMSQI